MTTDCAWCGHHHDTGWILCPRCTERIDTDLDTLTHAHHHLPHRLIPDTTGGDNVRGKRIDPPAPADLDVLGELDSRSGYVLVLSRWALVIRTAAGHPAWNHQKGGGTPPAPPRQTPRGGWQGGGVALRGGLPADPGDLARLHRRWLPWTAHHLADAGQYAAEIAAAAGRVRALLDGGNRRIDLGPCPVVTDEGPCTGRLKHNPVDPVIRCPACRADWHYEDWPRLRLLMADSQTTG